MQKEIECEHCSNAKQSCLAKNPKGIGYCTREAGHKGDHVACFDDKEHTQKTWPNK